MQNFTIPQPPPTGDRNLAQGTYSKEGEKLDYTYYDTCLIKSASTDTMKYFQAPQGQIANDGSTVKLLHHTNMTLGGQIPRGQRLTIRCIKIEYLALTQFADTTILAWYKFLAYTTCQFFITGKDALSVLTLQELLGAATLVLPAVTSTTFSSTVNRIILPRFHGIFPLNTPITLAEQTNFEVRVTPQVATPTTVCTGDFLKIGLSGILERFS
jgi:hypothetical protein